MRAEHIPPGLGDCSKPSSFPAPLLYKWLLEAEPRRADGRKSRMIRLGKGPVESEEPLTHDQSQNGQVQMIKQA